MHSLKQPAMAFLGAIAFGVFGTGPAPAADIPVEPGPPVYQRAVPQYAPAPVEVYPPAPPPVVYGYAPPPVVYYDYPPPVVVTPGVVYPRRYVYGYGHPRYYGYRGYGPYVARGYGHYGHRAYRRW